MNELTVMQQNVTMVIQITVTYFTSPGTRKFVTLQHAIYILQLNPVLINFHLNTLCKTLLRKEYVYIMIQLWLQIIRCIPFIFTNVYI